MKKPAIILSGGSEVISIAVAEELMENGVSIAVISLAKNSILKGLNALFFYEIEWPPKNEIGCVNDIINFAIEIGASRDNKLPIIPTEDGGLRFLFEHALELGEYLLFGGASKLSYSGLDKAEFFNYLKDNVICTDTVSVKSIDEAVKGIGKFNKNCIIKPSIKPLSMNMKGMNSKAIEISPNDSCEKIIRNLQCAWPISETWILQPKLKIPKTGEYGVWFVRNKQGVIHSLAGTELWKQPKIGGTGCWVKSLGCVDSELFPKVSDLLRELDFVGIGEISFLLDDNGNYKLVELNARPWLQVGLAKVAGFSIVYAYYCVLVDIKMPDVIPQKDKVWVNFERMLLAAGSGEYGSRVGALWTVFKVLCRADYVAVWNSLIPGLRYRWVRNLIFKVFK